MNVEVKEVEVSRIKTLERVTVTGQQSYLHNNNSNNSNNNNNNSSTGATVTVNAVIYSNEYYCIDDPIVLKGKDRVRIRVIGSATSEEELYRLYLHNNARNTLNPFMLLLLLKEGKEVVKEVLPPKVIVDIPSVYLERLNEHLIAIEEESEYSRIIDIEVDILIAVKRLLEEGLTLDEVIELIDLGISESSVVIKYPTLATLIALKEKLVKERKKEEKEKEEKDKREREGRGEEEEFVPADITTSIKEEEKKEEVVVTTGGTEERGSREAYSMQGGAVGGREGGREGEGREGEGGEIRGEVRGEGEKGEGKEGTLGGGTVRGGGVEEEKKVTFYSLSVTITVRCPEYYLTVVKEELRHVKEYAVRRLKRYGTVN